MLNHDGLTIEHLSWQLPYGPPTEALVLKPERAAGKLPAVVALHDHGGNKYFGLRKITRMGNEIHPMMVKHQELYYGGVAWANELAKRGYVVLVHDGFLFGSRRVRAADLPDVIKKGLTERNPESPEEIERYNKFAAEHENLVAKSLFCAGTTWPGVFLSEDQSALDYLAARADVDASRIGCAGLSGGGLRTAYLSGMDERIKVACCVGMMTTWRDYLLNKCHTHTWMIYIPGLPVDLDSRGDGTACALTHTGAVRQGGHALYPARDGTIGSNSQRGLRQGGRGRSVSGLLLSWSPQIRSRDAGGSLFVF
jgi:dienelactone hydrolase